MATQRAQHNVQAQEEAPQVPGAGRPVAAGEAVRSRCDPDVDGSVRGACWDQDGCQLNSGETISPAVGGIDRTGR